MTDQTADAPAASPENEAAIRACVREFYVLARADDLLGPVFNGSIPIGIAISRPWMISGPAHCWAPSATGLRRPPRTSSWK